MDRAYRGPATPESSPLYKRWLTHTSQTLDPRARALSLSTHLGANIASAAPSMDSRWSESQPQQQQHQTASATDPYGAAAAAAAAAAQFYNAQQLPYAQYRYYPQAQNPNSSTSNPKPQDPSAQFDSASSESGLHPPGVDQFTPNPYLPHGGYDGQTAAALQFAQPQMMPAGAYFADPTLQQSWAVQGAFQQMERISAAADNLAHRTYAATATAAQFYNMQQHPYAQHWYHSQAQNPKSSHSNPQNRIHPNCLLHTNQVCARQVLISSPQIPTLPWRLRCADSCSPVRPTVDDAGCCALCRSNPATELGHARRISAELAFVVFVCCEEDACAYDGSCRIWKRQAASVALTSNIKQESLCALEQHKLGSERFDNGLVGLLMRMKMVRMIKEEKLPGKDLAKPICVSAINPLQNPTKKWLHCCYRDLGLLLTRLQMSDVRNYFVRSYAGLFHALLSSFYVSMQVSAFAIQTACNILDPNKFFYLDQQATSKLYGGGFPASPQIGQPSMKNCLSKCTFYFLKGHWIDIALQTVAMTNGMIDPSPNPMWNSSAGRQFGKSATKKPKKIKVVQSAWCEICNIECNSKDVLDKHKMGKKHKKNLEKIEEAKKEAATAKAAANRNPAAAKATPGEAGNAASGQATRRKGGPGAEVEDLETKRRKLMESGAAADSLRVCAICNVAVNSETVFNYHLAGQKHAAQVKKHAAAVAGAAAPAVAGPQAVTAS
ncbi:hypothetical protein ACLOJK_038493 [Asimina triloba]